MGRTQKHEYVTQMHSHPKQFERFEVEVCPLYEAFPKVVIPLRHPYKAYRSYGRSGVSHEAILEHWECLVEKEQEFQEIYYVPIECKEEERRGVMQGLADFLGIKDPEWPITYADAWKPANVGVNNGPLAASIPDLDFAVEWFDEVSRQKS